VELSIPGKINGVSIRPLRVIPDDRGRLMEALRCDDPEFDNFGQVYITTTYPGIVKAWHCHEKQADNVVCIAGMIKLALWDGRKESSTRRVLEEHVLGIHQPALVHIPPGVWHGWKALGTEEAVILNIPNKPYNHSNPDEIRRPWNDAEIGFEWETRFR